MYPFEWTRFTVHSASNGSFHGRAQNSVHGDLSGRGGVLHIRVNRVAEVVKKNEKKKDAW